MGVTGAVDIDPAIQEYVMGLVKEHGLPGARYEGIESFETLSDGGLKVTVKFKLAFFTMRPSFTISAEQIATAKKLLLGTVSRAPAGVPSAGPTAPGIVRHAQPPGGRGAGERPVCPGCGGDAERASSRCVLWCDNAPWKKAAGK